MRIQIALLVVFVASACSLLLSANKPPSPGWSEIKVLVLEDPTGKPAGGARVENTCKLTPYFGRCAETDTNGVAHAMISETLVALKATWNGVTNFVTLTGTNAVAKFRTNAVIRLKQVTNEPTR